MSSALRKIKRKAERHRHLKSRLRLINEHQHERDLQQSNLRLSGIVVHAVGCTWWDVIEKAGAYKTPPNFPCCPFCGSLLMQHDNEKAFWAGSEKYEKEHPGYIALMKWMQGKCFKTMHDAAIAYESATGIHYEVAIEEKSPDAANA